MPGLQSQVVNVPFGTGMDQKTQEELVDPNAAMLNVTNLRIDKTGAYRKRLGYSVLDNTLSSADRVGQLSGIPFAIDGVNLWSSFGNVSPAPVKLGQVPKCVGTRTPALNANGLVPNIPSGLTPFNSLSTYDVGHANNVTVIAGRTGIYVYNATTGAVLLQTSGGVGPIVRCIGVGNVIVILYGDDSIAGQLGNISRVYIDTLNISAGVQGITDPPIVTGAWFYYPIQQAWGFFDICKVDSTHYALAFPDGGGGINIIVKTFTATATLPSATTVVARAGAVSAMSCGVGCTVGDVLWVAFANTASNVSSVALNPTTLAVVSSTNATTLTSPGGSMLNLSVIPTTTRKAIVMGSTLEVLDSPFAYVRMDGTSSPLVIDAAFGGQTNIYRHHMVGKPFSVDSRYYVPLVSQHDPLGIASDMSDTEPTCVLADLTDLCTAATSPVSAPRPTAIVAPRLVDIFNQSPMACATIATASAKEVTLVKTKTNDVGSALEFTTFDFAYPNMWQNAEVNGSAVLSGGLPSSFDTQSVTEIGFTRYPEYIVVQPTGIDPLTGTFSYTAIYEWTTTTGDIVRSAPAAPFQIVIAGTKAEVIIPTLQLTSKDRFGGTDSLQSDQVSIAVYRTTDQGTVYYRVGTVRNQSSAGIGVPAMTLTDGTDDAALQLNETLYTQPGLQGTALPRACPPSSTVQILHRNRIWLVGDDGVTVWYSGQIVQGEQPWFADQFTIPVVQGGSITALASMDGVLYVFKRSVIFSISGNGPSDNDTSNDLSTPEEMDVETGCIEPRSLVIAPDGIFFQSPKGIYLLTRARSLVYLGRDVEDILAAYPVIVSAVNDDVSHCCMWEAVSTDDPNAGVTIVYDYLHGKWMVDHKLFPIDTGATSAIMIDGRYYWSSNGSNARLYRQFTSQYFDAVYQKEIIETAWIKLAGLQGYQRIRGATLLARHPPSSGYGIRISVYYDYDDTAPIDVFQWTAAELTALITAREQLGMDLTRQKSESVRFKIEDVQDGSSANGDGPILVGLALEVGIKQGRFKLPAANSK